MALWWILMPLMGFHDRRWMGKNNIVRFIFPHLFGEISCTWTERSFCLWSAFFQEVNLLLLYAYWHNLAYYMKTHGNRLWIWHQTQTIEGRQSPIFDCNSIWINIFWVVLRVALIKCLLWVVSIWRNYTGYKRVIS